MTAAPSTIANTNMAASPLQQLAAMFQRAGIQPNMQASSAAPVSQLPQNQEPQTQVQQGMVPPPQTISTGVQSPGALANLVSMYPQLAQSLGTGTQQSWDGQSPQTPNYDAILNILNGTTVNGTDQVTAQPSFINSIYRMLP